MNSYIESKKHKPLTLRVGITVTALFIFIAAIFAYIMNHILGISYGDSSMMKVFFFQELILIGIMIYVVKSFSSWKEIGFAKIQWKYTLWLLPGVILLAIFKWPGILSALTNPEPGVLNTIGFIAITTLLIGISEELMFRGVLLRSALTQKGIYKAMLISALGFSLLHAVNLFGGLELSAIPIQLLFTFIMGMVFAPLALKIRSIFPLIIYHGVWDFSTISATTLDISNPIFILLNTILSLIIIAILWIQMRKQTPESVKII